MLLLNSKPVAATTHTHLASVQQAVNNEASFESQTKKAKSKWDGKTSGNGRTTFTDVKTVLIDMSVGVEICVYCEQNEGTDIEHIFPKRLYPEKSFPWENYVLACGKCNTHYKCDHFSIFNPSRSVTKQDVTPQKGVFTKPDNEDALFLNQRIDNPLDYLELDLVNGLFVFTETHPAGTREYKRARYTVALLGLNTREQLVQARRAAARFFVSRLEMYVNTKAANNFQELSEAVDDFDNVDLALDFVLEKQRIEESIKQAILLHAHPTVWKELMRQRQRLTKTNSFVNQAPEVLTW